MIQLPAIYSDKSGKVKTIIHNVFAEKGTECLEMQVDGIPFIGSSFDTFELKMPEKYSEEQLKRFTFNKIPVHDTGEFILELCNCSIDFHIPQIVESIENETDIEADLHIVLKLGKPSKNGAIDSLKAQFTLQLEKNQFISDFADFETALSQIQKEMMPDYRFRNCFSCHYSDYSPLGNGFFAGLMCYKKNKAAYLTAAKKEDFIKLAAEGYIAVQETYLCNEFAPREKGTGYRGWPFD